MIIAGFLVNAHTQEEPYTETWVVSDDLLSSLESNNPASISARYRKVFADAGIQLPEEAAVEADPVSGYLRVTASVGDQKRISELLQRMAAKGKHSVAIRFEEIILNAGEAEKLKSELWDPTHPPVGGLPKGVRIFRSERSLIEELSKKPIPANEADPVVATGISGSFTEKQFEVVRAKIRETGFAMQSVPEVATESGRAILAQAGDSRWGAIPTVSNDGFTIDLSLFLPASGESLDSGADEGPSCKVTLWSGQTAAWAEHRESGELRFVFVTVRVPDRDAVSVR